MKIDIITGKERLSMFKFKLLRFTWITSQVTTVPLQSVVSQILCAVKAINFKDLLLDNFRIQLSRHLIFSAVISPRLAGGILVPVADYLLRQSAGLLIQRMDGTAQSKEMYSKPNNTSVAP